jgi:hypothetical protein
MGGSFARVLNSTEDAHLKKREHLRCR